MSFLHLLTFNSLNKNQLFNFDLNIIDKKMTSLFHQSDSFQNIQNIIPHDLLGQTLEVQFPMKVFESTQNNKSQIMSFGNIKQTKTLENQRMLRSSMINDFLRSQYSAQNRKIKILNKEQASTQNFIHTLDWKTTQNNITEGTLMRSSLRKITESK